MNGHQLIEARSLRLHRAVAEKMKDDPRILEKARDRAEGWLIDGSVHSHYAKSWCQMLAMELEELSRFLVDPGEEMTALRQCSPFAGALDPRERWRILREERRASEP